MKPRVIVVDSDQHAGSKLGLITPAGVEDSDGMLHLPGDAQKHLWNEHENYVDDAAAIIKKWRRKGATAHYVNLGDLTDGDHHNTHQIISRDLGVHVAVARNILAEGFLRLDFDTLHFIGGTPAHVGPGGALEKSIAKNIADAGYPIVRYPRTGTTVWPEMTAQIGAYPFDFKHHGRVGTREHTRKSFQALYAYDIWGTALTEGRRPPAISVRAHNHKMMDSGPDLRGVTRVCATGCWQYSSEWVASKAIESRPDFGGWIFVVTDDMRDPYDIWARPFRYHHPDVEEVVWHPAA